MVYSFFEEIAKKYSDNIALSCIDNKSVSYNKLFEDIKKVSGYLSTISEEEIIIICNNTYQCILRIYAGLCVGKRVILLDPNNRLEDLKDIIEFCDTKKVFISEKEKVFIEQLSSYDLCYFEDEIQYNICEKYKNGEAVFYTSGTSNKAKGIILAGENIIKRCCRSSKILAMSVNGDIYVPVSSSHVFFNSVITFLNQGRKIYVGTIRTIIRDVQKYKPAILIASPNIFSTLVEYSDNIEFIKLIILGGSKCDEAIKEKADSLGILLQNLYGATELGGSIAMTVPGGKIDEFYLSQDVKVLYEADKIAVETDTLMKGYYHNEKLTKEVLGDKKFYISDELVKNQNGTYSILGRKDNIIVMNNGMKLYFEEMELKIKKQINEIEEVCILYIDDKIIAIVKTLKDSKDVLEKLKVFNKNQPFFAKIHEIFFNRDEFEYTSIGKLKRGKVQQEFEKGKYEREDM